MNILRSNDIDSSLDYIEDGLVEVLTYANKSNFYFPYLLKSANKFKYPLKILGYNSEWKGYSSKLRYTYEYLTSLPIYYQDRYFLFVDAWDVLFIRDYLALVSELINVDYDLIISSDKISESDGTNRFLRYMIHYHSKKNINYYANENLNSGLYIMKISKFIEMYNLIDPLENSDDQIMICKYIKIAKNLNYIIDHSRYYLFSINGLAVNQDDILEKLKITPAFVIHAFASGDMEKYLKYYFTNISFNELESVRPNTSKIIKEKIPYYAMKSIENIWFELIIITFVAGLLIKKYLKRIIK